jgi:hypothetical protein
MNKALYPRDSAGSFTLPSDRGDPIVDMCSLDDRLEIYTASETFMVQTPETIDPDRTNPNAPWVNAKTHDVGSASPYVARTFIMASDMLNHRGHPPVEEDCLGALRTMHVIKETLLQCANALSTFSTAQAAEEVAVEESGFRRDPAGRALARFPVVPALDAKVTAFLIPARRCVTEICRLTGHFFALKQAHSNLAHLLDKELIPRLSSDNPLVRFVVGHVSLTGAVLAMRNGQEHSATMHGRRLTICNFSHRPDGSLARPTWKLDGDDPSYIEADMAVILEDLLILSEGMFVACFDQTKPAFPPFVIEAIEAPDPRRPVRYRLCYDASRLPMAQPIG